MLAPMFMIQKKNIQNMVEIKILNTPFLYLWICQLGINNHGKIHSKVTDELDMISDSKTKKNIYDFPLYLLLFLHFLFLF